MTEDARKALLVCGHEIQGGTVWCVECCTHREVAPSDLERLVRAWQDAKAERFSRITDGKVFGHPEYDAADIRLMHATTALLAWRPAATPAKSIDGQDGYYAQQTCSRCGVEAIDYKVICAMCEYSSSPLIPEGESRHELKG